MSPLNHKRTTSSLAPPIFYVAKNVQLKDTPLLQKLEKPKKTIESFYRIAIACILKIFYPKLNIHIEKLQ